MKTWNKIVIFIVWGGAGAFVGSLLGYPIGNSPQGIIRTFIGVGVWDALIGIGIGLALALSQNRYLRRINAGYKDIAKSTLRCAGAGFAGGIALVACRIFLGSSNFSTTIAWGFEGLMMGYFIAPLIPNLPLKIALIAGGTSGIMGAILMILLSLGLGVQAIISVAIGDSLKGMLLGAMLAFAETLVKEAWLVVHWAPKEESIILLGQQPILIGSSSDCQIYLKKSLGFPPIAATIALIQDQIILEDKTSGSQRYLVNGNKVQMGNLSIEVRAKKN